MLRSTFITMLLTILVISGCDSQRNYEVEDVVPQPSAPIPHESIQLPPNASPAVFIGLCPASKNVTILTDGTFKASVKDSKGYVVVDFCADWCGPCRRSAPFFNDFADKYVGQFRAFRCTDNEQITLDAEGIQAIPCIVVYKDGKEVDRTYGYHDADGMKEKFELFTGEKLTEEKVVENK